MITYIRTFTANEAHTDKEGYAVNASSGKAVLVTAATDLPIGVIRRGGASGALSDIALAGEIVPVKLSGNVTKGAHLQIAADGTFVTNAGSGARVLAAIALETGVSGDQVDALIITPIIYSA